MRLPRHHPFTSHSGETEIAHLHSLFYPQPFLPAHQAHSKRQRGVDLVQSLYLAKGGCPVAIECTSSLVASLLLDHQLSSSHTSVPSAPLPPPPVVSLAIRQTLTLSLIRLVNTLADALQKGAFARSIASIAERELGLPQWFVEFRHRGTHEELPSLEVCREVVASALAWIEGSYWLPTLRDAERRRRLRSCRSRISSPKEDEEEEGLPPQQHSEASGSSVLLFPSTGSRASSSSGAVGLNERLERYQLPELLAILGNYKRLSKTLVKDQSLRGQKRNEMQTIYRQVDHWLESTRQEIVESDNATDGRGVLQSGSRRSDRRKRPVHWAVEDDEDDAGEDDDHDGNDDDQDDVDGGEDSLESSNWEKMRHGLGNIPCCSSDPALQIFIAVLLSPTRGVGLIPLSKSKRAKRSRWQDGTEEEGEIPTLPDKLLETWSGLLNHLCGHDRGQHFIGTWLAATIDLLLEEVSSLNSISRELLTPESIRLDSSSRLTLLAWVKFILDSLSPPTNSKISITSAQGDETTSLRGRIAFHLLRQADENERRPSPKSGGDARQTLLLSLVKRLLTSAARCTSASGDTGSSTAASLATLLRDLASRLDETARSRLEKVMRLLPLPLPVPLPLSEVGGKSQGDVDSQDDEGSEMSNKRSQRNKQKRDSSDGAVAVAEQDSTGASPLLYGFEQMDPVGPSSAAPHSASTRQNLHGFPPSSEVANGGGPTTAKGPYEGQGPLSNMEEMERRWRQVLASSSSPSSAFPSVAPPASKLAAKAKGPTSDNSAQLDDWRPSSSGLPPRSTPPTATPPAVPAAAAAAEAQLLPAGWTLFAAEDWRPTPIGMLRRRHQGAEGSGEETEEGTAYVPDFLRLSTTGPDGPHLGLGE